MSRAASKKDRKPLWRRRITVPFYRVGEAARYARSNPQTVARWHRLGVVAEKELRAELNYGQLIELAVVAAMRRAGIPLGEIRDARGYFAKLLEEEFPFASRKFRAHGKQIVTDYAEIEPETGLNKLLYTGGQLGWAELVEPVLKEFEYDNEEIAVRWRVAGVGSPILIDPQVAFGAPHVAGAATWVLRNRYDAGESVGDIADDFEVDANLVVEALKFEGRQPDMSRPSYWVN